MINDAMEQMNIAIVGHVDHGKSTVIGRLLADTNSLPKGKLEQVKATCEQNAKPFEYAFLLDALKDEQAQGITIDIARCFFKTEKRRYIILDSPGHIEFLKNMLTGAARAEAVFLVIDAGEGIRENSKRHGYIVSMLGINQISVLVNKMDLVGYDKNKFLGIKSEYTEFLARLNLQPKSFIPVSAARGVNIVSPSPETPWYNGLNVLEQFDSFWKREPESQTSFRFPVQDVYKFTETGDDRRIIAGTIETGSVGTGDEIVFLPSGKKSRIDTIESFNAPEKTTAVAGESAGFTLKTQVYVKPGELMAKATDKLPQVGTRFRVNLFWMGKAPMIKGKRYKLKLGTARTPLQLVEIDSIIDASELSSEQNKQQIERYDVAECILETPRPIAFDLISDIEHTGRFAVVDNYEISGAGIILEKVADDKSTLKDHVREREFAWESSSITPNDRAALYGHGAKLVVFTGNGGNRKEVLATALERRLFSRKFKVYYLRMANVLRGLDADITYENEVRDEHIRRLGELARIITGSGQIFITSVSSVDDYDLKTLELLNKPNEILVINIGENRFNDYKVALNLDEYGDIDDSLDKVFNLLRQKNVIIEYNI